MCGIAGLVYSDPSRTVSSELLKTMCDRMVHRGPDDYGSFIAGHVGLGMRRLSIIDLSTGHQPIANEDETVWIVFNGEIYNYQELRQELQGKGHRFKTTSDTEVIVHLYEEVGERCVERLRGMFAFAVWDTRQQLLLLARDRIGIKPLYYAKGPKGLAFGSELKVLLADGSLSREVNPIAVAEYFQHLSVPGNLSIYKSVKKLEPATVLLYRNGAVRFRRYWQVQPDPDDAVPESEWVERLRDHLRDAVQCHMIADVPVGGFLSGGLDSGGMTAIMAQSARQPIRTFTVGFMDKAGRFDERDAARVVARQYGTNHFECLLEADVRTLLPSIVQAFDEPFADSSAIPNWLVCQETAKHVKVALSGLGGDELFGGYERYSGLLWGERFAHLPRIVRKMLARAAAAVPAGDGTSYTVDRLKRFVDASELSLVERYRSFITAFRDVRDILRPDVLAGLGQTEGRYEEVARQLRVRNALDFGLFMDLSFYLPDDLLPLSDRISMAHSLEVRVPFLDHHLVEFAAKIPARLKVRSFQKKYILRRAIEPWLPPGHLARPKQGFSVPLAAWLRGALKPMVLDLVESRQCKESAWLRPDVVRRMTKEHMAGVYNHEVRLWAVICFLEWERQMMAARVAS